ncbi:hypothetical protein PRUPE_1G581800 [Prunus persica]|uniref:Uncharacterized protein n=1 Tax=Prunus persica TaxID=3760 RepID=A0A251RK86_PRUPE|nr:hypothetical protein PRUPE_1G581800 [Prunus persica]
MLNPKPSRSFLIYEYVLTFMYKLLKLLVLEIPFLMFPQLFTQVKRLCLCLLNLLNILPQVVQSLDWSGSSNQSITSIVHPLICN